MTIRRRLFGAVGLAASIGLSGAEGLATGPQATTRTVYVSVLDEDGQRVDGLTPSDLTVQDDGRECVVVSVSPPSTRMQLTIAVEAGMARYGDVRKPIHDLAARLLPEADVSLMVIRRRPERVAGPTDDINAIVSGLNSFLPNRPLRFGADSTVRLDSIIEIVETIRRSTPARPAFVFIAWSADVSGGVQRDSQVAGPVLGRIRDSGPIFHAVSIAGRGFSSVFSDGSTHSGGQWIEWADANQFAAALNSIGDDLSAQYLVTYALPDGAEPSGRLEVTLNRPGAVLRAPTRVAQ